MEVGLLSALCFLVLTYLLAAIPFGLLVTLLVGGERDIRLEGSGNIGATNVARLYGVRIGAVVMGYDVAKGLVPVLIAAWGWPDFGLTLLGFVAAFAFLGHCYPPYLGFRGGKGVATGAGAMFGLAPLPTLAAFGGWFVLLVLSRRSSVASLGATVVLVVAMGSWQPEVLPVGVLLCLGVVWSHLPNLRRLVTGKEAAVVARPRWGRSRPVEIDVAAVLASGPAGPSSAPPTLWKEVR